MRLLICVLLSLLLAAGCSLGQGNIAARSGYREVAERLTNFIRHEMADKGLPALSIVLVDDQETVWGRPPRFSSAWHLRDRRVGLHAT